MTCTNAYDTITQAAGLALPNQFNVPVTHLAPVVTSSCRTADGTWIAWFQNDPGDSINAFGSQASGDSNKADWPSRIASSVPIGVGFFADDGSGPVIYELGLEWPCFKWNTIPLFSDFDPCSILFPLPQVQFSNGTRSQMTAWFTQVIDIQIRTDGANVWIVGLARETTLYKYLYGPGGTDRCGILHSSLLSEALSEGCDAITGYAGDVFAHDTDTGRRWWEHYGSSVQAENDDPGRDSSFRWQPARVTVWAGDIGGFTRLDTINATYANDLNQGLISGVEACTSSAEPGVCHVMWAEAGRKDTYLTGYGERVNYSRWDAAGKLGEVDLRDSWTGEFALRNDSGPPVAFIAERVDGGVGPIQAWDLDALVVVQTLDSSLVPTAAEAGITDDLVGTENVAGNASVFTVPPRRRILASSLYTDPLRDGTDVYLLAAPYGPKTSNVEGASVCVAFYRIPADLSAPFEFLDGIRSVSYSIVQGFTDSNGESLFRSDFVSDPDDVWMPAENTSGGGAVLRLDRQCLRGWQLLPAFPVPSELSGYDTVPADWHVSTTGTSPPMLLGDWLASGGIGTPIPLSNDHVPIAALRAKICRCCLPCNRTGMHVWEVL